MKHEITNTEGMRKRFDVSRATLFRWEREGRITKPVRDWRGWRIYTSLQMAEVAKLVNMGRVCSRKT